MGVIPINLKYFGKIGFYRRDIAGQHVLVGEPEKIRFLAGVKVTPQPVESAWRKRLGHYKVVNQPEATIFQVKDLEFKLTDGYLLSVITRAEDGPSTVILQTVNEKEAVIAGLGTGLGETIRIGYDDKGEELIFYEGLRFKLTRKPASTANCCTKKTGT